MKIEFLKKFRCFKAGEVFTVKLNTVNFWVGVNGTGKSTLAAAILSELQRLNKKLVPKRLWMATFHDKVIELTGWEKFTGLTFVSDKNRQSQYVDIDALINMGIGRIWSSEGQNAQQDVVGMAKYMHDSNHLTILDETDGHLDFPSKTILFNAILENIKGTVIVISHDSFFMNGHNVFDFKDRKFKTGDEYYRECREILKQKPKSVEKPLAKAI